MAVPGSLPVAQEALERLRIVLQDADALSSCHNFLGTNVGKTKADRWRRVQFSPELASQFRAMLARGILEALPNASDLVDFSFEDPVASQVLVIGKEDYPDLGDWIDEVPDPDWHLTFDGDASFLGKVKLHVAVLAGAGLTSNLKVFRRRTAASLVKKQGLLGALTASKDEFTSVKGQVFDFPVDAEILEWENKIYILDLGAFEALTNIREVTLNQAAKAFVSIRAIENLEVPNLAGVQECLNLRPRLAKRLAAAVRHNTFASLQVTTLTDHIEQFNLPLVIKIVGDKTQIVFEVDNRIHVEEFVNLIADVYLRSPVTQINYKAHSKELARPRQ